MFFEPVDPRWILSPTLFFIGHLLLTVIIYLTAFKDDISKINKNKFSRTKITIIIFIVASIIFAIALYDAASRIKRETAGLVLLTFWFVNLSFSAIVLSAFILIVVRRINVGAKLLRLDALLILVSVPFFLVIAFFLYIHVVFTLLGP
jgi:hypothetical protein